MSDTQILSTVITAVSQVGFPIVVAGYLLIQVKKTLDLLSENISRLIDVIKQTERAHK
ncbi:YvrJ family protein [Paenibacillus sp. FSL L8-0436]|uniref:YvrJ family protein n=1 Tax=Paenibacillus sp. FSL L8-0436 TaxID=2954686 RepID=UPI0031599356